MDLYSDAILALNQSPKNEGKVDGETHRARLSNPLCGDRVDVSIRMKDGRIEEVRATTRGCAVARAAGSLMTVDACGLSKEGIDARAPELKRWLQGEHSEPDSEAELSMLDSARAYQARWGCVLLPWKALAKALASTDR